MTKPIAVAALVVVASSPAGQQSRVIAAQDRMAFGRTAGPQMSPEGTQGAFTRVVVNQAEGEYETVGTGATGLAAAVFEVPSRAAQQSRTFTGVVTDERCAVEGHAAMRMGPTDAECAKACADEHGDALVLLDAEHVYQLSDQKQARTFVGETVRVVGVLDAKTETIRVLSMRAVPASPASR